MWVVDAKTGALIKTYETPKEPGALMNDLEIAGGYAYFTDSFRPVFYRAKVGAKPGELEPWLDFTGTPLAYDKGVNLNGIAATPDGKTLLVVQMNKGLLFKIDIATKKVTPIDLKGETVPGSDGLVLHGSTVYAVRQPAGEIVTIAMNKDLTAGEVKSRFTDPAFIYPATATVVGDKLLVVNTQFNKRASGATTPFTVSSVPLATLNPK
jgi:Cu-Zn family superoxide dismutase